MLLTFPGWGPQSLLLMLVYFVYIIKHPGWSSTSTSRAEERLGAQCLHPEGVRLQAFLSFSAREGRQEPVLLFCHPPFHPFAPSAEGKNGRLRSKEFVFHRDRF